MAAIQRMGILLAGGALVLLFSNASAQELPPRGPAVASAGQGTAARDGTVDLSTVPRMPPGGDLGALPPPHPRSGADAATYERRKQLAAMPQPGPVSPPGPPPSPLRYRRPRALRQSSLPFR
jgi:hypothetical protein